MTNSKNPTQTEKDSKLQADESANKRRMKYQNFADQINKDIEFQCSQVHYNIHWFYKKNEPAVSSRRR